MTKFKYAIPAVSVAALLSGSAAYAQVSAQQVWDNWKSSFDMYEDGIVTIGSEDLADGVLTVTDISINSVDEESGVTVSGTIASVEFTEQGDGSVAVTMSEETPITIATVNADGTETTVSLALRQTDMEIVVSGSPDVMTYDLSATRSAIELDEITEDGVAVPAEASLAINDMAGTYTITTADMRTVEYDVGAASVDLAVNVTDQETKTLVDISGTIMDLASTVSMMMPLPENTTPETVLMDGMAMEGGYTFGQSDYVFDISEAGVDSNGTATVEGGSLDFVLSKDNFGYSSASTGIAINATSPMMPFPVTITLAEYGLDLLMPMSKTDEPVDYAVGVNLTDLSLNEEIWALVDPGATLPRDPATVQLDVTGTAKLLFDLVDPAQSEAMAMAAAPGEIHSLNLNNLSVSFGGANLAGKGAFTFDNADMTTFPGFPRPEGSVDLVVNGANGLMDKLVEIGLLPGEQVQMARMMMGMFAIATGDDQLTTKVEIGADGAIMINGQPMPM